MFYICEEFSLIVIPQKTVSGTELKIIWIGEKKLGVTELIFYIREIICNKNSSVEPPYSPIPEYFIFLCKLVLYIETMQNAIITIIKYTLKR